MRTVMIINDHSEPLELYSLFGATNEFFSSSLKKNILQPYGGNTSIIIYYLPKTVGIKNSIFTITTNRGNLLYYVNKLFYFIFLNLNFFIIYRLVVSENQIHFIYVHWLIF